jgi:hypothetical protein
MHIALFAMMFIFGTGISMGVMYESYKAKKHAAERMVLVLFWLSVPLALLMGYLVYAAR